ncbi:hypothetical protein TSOC_009032 [Tetrabaena socialis]|uniref:Uncharacterized protein n=1 Tax=Tetrabaena socialis TaxID=47790 RepID=A0A2J7ZWU7_9CHLO|nr:hypothetical protein TSOC_009032 [Tetrabaena socialis]|eukprot:PNH04736.1 hypothetical protein TSOC_009032 [Tetrabaena socialis]
MWLYLASDTSYASAISRKCLKAVKLQLLAGCRNAVTARQAAAAEDLSLDPDMQRDCGEERDVLCLEAGSAQDMHGNGRLERFILGLRLARAPELRGTEGLPGGEPAPFLRMPRRTSASATFCPGLSSSTREKSRSAAAKLRRTGMAGDTVS